MRNHLHMRSFIETILSSPLLLRLEQGLTPMVVVEGLGCGGNVDLDIFVCVRAGPDGPVAYRVASDGAAATETVATVRRVVRAAATTLVAWRDDSLLFRAAAKTQASRKITQRREMLKLVTRSSRDTRHYTYQQPAS